MSRNWRSSTTVFVRFWMTALTQPARRKVTLVKSSASYRMKLSCRVCRWQQMNSVTLSNRLLANTWTHRGLSSVVDAWLQARQNATVERATHPCCCGQSFSRHQQWHEPLAIWHWAWEQWNMWMLPQSLCKFRNVDCLLTLGTGIRLQVQTVLQRLMDKTLKRWNVCLPAGHYPHWMLSRQK